MKYGNAVCICTDSYTGDYCETGEKNNNFYCCLTLFFNYIALNIYYSLF